MRRRNPSTPVDKQLDRYLQQAEGLILAALALVRPIRASMDAPPGAARARRRLEQALGALQSVPFVGGVEEAPTPLPPRPPQKALPEAPPENSGT